jgi:hypothetical protein
VNGCPRILVKTNASDDAAEKLVRMSERLRSFTTSTAARESETVARLAGVFVRRMLPSASSWPAIVQVPAKGAASRTCIGRTFTRPTTG